MKEEIYDLLGAIRTWHGHVPQMPPEQAKASSAELITSRRPQVRLPPQVTWTLLALIYYRDRKRKTWKMLRKRLPAQLAAERGDKMVTIDDVLQGGSSGIVPGKPEWSYELDGNASFVTNRVTGEHIHVDILNGPDVMNRYYFSEYLVKLRKPHATARRLLGLFPEGRGLALAIHRLHIEEVLHVVDECNGEICEFELCGVVDPFVESVSAFLSAWTDEANRSTLGAVIGDWTTVKNAAEAAGAVPGDEVTSHAEASRRRWLALLHYEAGGVLSGDLLYALADAEAEDLPDYLRRALGDLAVATDAVEIMGDDPVWRTHVETLFTTAVSDKFPAHVKSAMAKYLARVGADVEPLLEGLLTAPEALRAAILLALDYGPRHLLALLRRGLRSRLSDTRLTAATILTLLDTEQSRRELLAVLKGSSDQDATVECRAALLESSDSDVHLTVEEWEAGHPEEERVPMTSDRFIYRFSGGCDQTLRQRMLELADRVNSLDNRQLFNHKPK